MDIAHLHLDLVALFAYLVVMIACGAGLFYSEYRDNWFQTIGMVLVGVGSGLQLHRVYHSGWIHEETLVLAVGLAIFSVGVAWKVWQHQRYLPPKGRLAK